MEACSRARSPMIGTGRSPAASLADLWTAGCLPPEVLSEARRGEALASPRLSLSRIGQLTKIAELRQQIRRSTGLILRIAVGAASPAGVPLVSALRRPIP